MEDKTIYLIQLEKLLSKASAESVTIMSKRLWKLQLIIDLCAVTKFFNDELVKIEKCYNLDIDKDVNYEEWASSEKWEPLQDTLRSRTKGRFNTEGKDIAYDIFSLVAKCIEVPSDEEMNKAQNNDNAENIRQLEKKEKREYYRSLLVSLDCNDEITDEELDEAVLKALYALQNVLKEISMELSSPHKANEKRVALYDALNQKFLPEGFIPMWDAHNVLKKWNEDYYGDSPEDDMKDFIMVKLFELLDSDFVICDREHDPLKSRNKTICEIEEYLNDKVNDEEGRRETISKYTFLRNLLEYKDGFYEIKSKEKIGKYIYEKRHNLSEDKIKVFFCFLGLNILVKEEVAKQKGEQNEVDEDAQDSIGPSVLTMQVDGKPVKVEGLRKFLDYVKEKDIDKGEGLALLDVMVIHGLAKGDIDRKRFCEGINNFYGSPLLFYPNCKSNDDLEFHKPLAGWNIENVITKRYKDSNHFASRKNIVTSLESKLLDLKK